MANIASTSKLAEAAYYDARFRDFDYANLLQLERAIHILDALLGTQLHRPRIVDLGCGPGWLAAMLSSVGPTTAIDLSPEAVANAHQRWPAVEYMAADIFEWDGPRENFDVVVSQEVLEHVEDQRRYLSIAHGLLRPGGFLILTTPNADTMWAMDDAQRRAWTNQPIENWVTRAQLAALLKPQFEIQKITTITRGLGTSGSYRLFNSARLYSLVRGLGAQRLFDLFYAAFGYGLHIVAIAQRRG